MAYESFTTLIVYHLLRLLERNFRGSGFATVATRGGEYEGTKRLKGQRDAALALAKRTIAEHGYVPKRRCRS